MNTKKFTYISILAICLISLGGLLWKFHIDNVKKESEMEIARQTEMMNQDWNLWNQNFKDQDIKSIQSMYLNVDVILKKYPKADMKLAELLQEFRDITEETYDLQQKYEVSVRTTARMIILSAVELMKGKNPLAPFDELDSSVEALRKRFKELQFRWKEVDVYLCDKYKIECKKESDKNSTKTQ